LPTPGKADVVVTILRDRDSYEICFVEDKAFYDLAASKFDVINFGERATRGGDGNPPPIGEKISYNEVRVWVRVRVKVRVTGESDKRGRWKPTPYRGEDKL
jgi:hypothetical protein